METECVINEIYLTTAMLIRNSFYWEKLINRIKSVLTSARNFHQAARFQ